MIPCWRRKKYGHRGGSEDMEILIPSHFKCPISLALMKDPVILSSGITYDREYIEKWLQAGNFTCPVTNQVLDNVDQIPNHTLRKMIQEWCDKNIHNGMERIPTPEVPITSMEVSEILDSIQASSSRLDQHACLESMQKIEKWGMESGRNRFCIIDNVTASVLGVAFDAFANDSYEKNGMVLEEILSVLNWMLPFGAEAKASLGSRASLLCMVWFLRSSDVSVKKHAVLILQELSLDTQVIERLGEIECVHENLFQLTKNQFCPIITKASLRVIYNLISFSSCSGSKFAEIGLISTLPEIIVDSNRSLCEKALGVFNKLCCCEKGMQEAYSNDLIMPVLVRKLLRVSELATEFSVSAIWRLCKEDEKNDEVKAAIETLQHGAFQKLVLLLQAGCSQKTKEKATELLKILNPLRPGKECIDSIDFKNLGRSF